MVESINELRRICYEGRQGPLTLYNKYIGTKVSIYITKLLLYTQITANQVTLAMLVLGVLGSIFLFNGYFLIGLLLIHFTVILDDVDGEIARYRKQSSMLGMHIDTVYHLVTTRFMLFGFAYGIYAIHPDKLLLIFGFISALFAHSIVVPAIFDTIASLKIRGITPPKLKPSKDVVTEFEGQTKEFKNPMLKFYHAMRNIWAFPSNLIMLTMLYIWELVNLKYLFVTPYTTSLLFFIVYGSLVALNQLMSFAFHVKKNSIDSFYLFLIGKK